MKKLFAMILVVSLSCTLIACGGGNETPDDSKKDPNDNPNPIITYTLDFEVDGGTQVTQQVKNSGSNVNEPQEPMKADYVFIGWYTDSSRSTEITWPVTLDRDKTVYAKWMAVEDYFFAAQDNLKNSDEFEYDFNLNVTTAVAGISGPSGNIVGTTKYDSSSNTPFYRHETITGALLFDGERHTFLLDDNLVSISIDDEGFVKDHEVEAVPFTFEYDYSTYAKVIFEYTKQQIESVTKLDNGKFEIEFSGGTSGIMDTVLGVLGNPIVAGFIGIPENDADFSSYVTIKDGEIESFEYDFVVDISTGILTFHYDLTINDNDKDINVPNFDNIVFDTNGLNTVSNELEAYLDEYLLEQYSEYTYKVVTGVDFDGEFSIDSTTQGRTMRKIDGGTTYFWNRVKFDSDYKNDDLYDHLGIEDYERYRVMYTNGSVHECIDGRIFNSYDEIIGYDNHSIDEFYLLLSSTLFESSDYSLIQTKVDGVKTTYNVVLKNEVVVDLMEYFDNSIRTDVYSSSEFDIFNIDTGLEVEDIKYVIIAEDGKLSSIDIDVTGSYVGSYPGTIFSGYLTFSIDYEIIVITPATEYVVPLEDSDVDLANN